MAGSAAKVDQILVNSECSSALTALRLDGRHMRTTLIAPSPVTSRVGEDAKVFPFTIGVRQLLRVGPDALRLLLRLRIVRAVADVAAVSKGVAFGPQWQNP